MAMVSHENPIREDGVAGLMATRGEKTVEEPVGQIIEDKIYVAVGKVVRKCKSILLWALQNSRGKRLCIIHVHVPEQTIPLMGTRLPVSSLEESKVKEYWEISRQEMLESLDEYLLICRHMGVRAERVYIESDCIEKGILELISQHGIRKLVMGAAADKRYSKRMIDIKSKKAISVRLEAPTACHLWFICKGHLIYTREGICNETIENFASLSVQARTKAATGQSDYLRSRSTVLGPNHRVNHANPSQDLFRRFRSLNLGRQAERGNALYASNDVAQPSGGLVSADILPVVTTEERENESGIGVNPPRSIEQLCLQLPPSVLDGNLNDILCYQLEQARIEACQSRREVLEEAMTRVKAENGAVDAVLRAKALENLYAEEVKQRKEIEEVLTREKERLESMKGDRDKVMEELHLSLNQKSLLENKISDSDQIVKELDRKILFVVELLQDFRKEREELQNEWETALEEAKELQRVQTELSSINKPRSFCEFSLLEIKEATQNFNQSLKIGEGGYGNIYKGVLRHTQVAIKILKPESKQGPSEFQQEVDVLSRIRHPNLVTLIGTCPEAFTLIYEYLPNGSLEDRLRCKDNSPPLSWQTRICIAVELCCVLIFLHSHSFFHGDLKPSNILLDANFMSKLGDFGISHLLSHEENSSNETTQCCRTSHPKGTIGYMDPDFFSSGKFTAKSDVYSFGIILLQLLTRRPACGIVEEVQHALDAGKLKTILDPLAGDWPFAKAEQVARLAMKCCDMNRRSRPDLASDVWRVLEPMRTPSGRSRSSLLQLFTGH